MKRRLFKVLSFLALSTLAGAANASERFPYKYISCSEGCGENGCGVRTRSLQIVDEGFHDVEMTAFLDTSDDGETYKRTVAFRAPMKCDLKDVDSDGFGTLLICNSYAGDSKFVMKTENGGVLDLAIPGFATKGTFNLCTAIVR